VLLALRGAIALTLLLGLAACDASVVTDVDVVADVDVVTDADVGPGVDVPPTVDADTIVEPPGPLFEVGTNVTGANTPDSFSPLTDGDELHIELGFQGLWMVVLAFRTRAIFPGQVTIITRIAVDGVVQGELGLAKQKLHPGGGGLDYYYNLFLVVMEPSVTGSTGTITLEVYDDEDHLVEETLEVELTGGATP
jgi:hypothetical protein